MNTLNQSEPAAVVVPGPDYKLAVPELDSPVLDLLNSTVSEELVRVTPSGNCYSVRHRSNPDAEWETLAEVATMQEAVKKAAYVQEFGVEMVKDRQTGLGEVYLNPGRVGGIAVRSRDHFLIQLTHTATDPIWRFRNSHRRPERARAGRLRETSVHGENTDGPIKPVANYPHSTRIRQSI